MQATKKPTTRERRRERTKSIILQAAEELLGEGGLQNMTLANIANRAAYSKPSIYEYFTGIEDILNELVNSGFIRLGKLVKAVPGTLSPEEQLIAAFYCILQFAEENAELYQLMFTHIIFKNNGQDLDSHGASKDTQAAYLAAAEIIQSGIDQGVFKTRPGFDHNAMIYLCWVTVHGMASLKPNLLAEVGMDGRQHQAVLVNLILNNLKGIFV
jgi:AcrR family transcriptional regulator